MSTSSIAMLELSSGLMSRSLSSWLLLWENSNFPGVGKAGKSSEAPVIQILNFIQDSLEIMNFLIFSRLRLYTGTSKKVSLA